MPPSEDSSSVVLIQTLQRRIRLPLKRLQRTARLALRALGRPTSEVHLTYVNDRQIRKLNSRFFGKHRCTDVLAFPLDEHGPLPLLGEVVISAETAQRQARRLGHSLEDELHLLTLHGLLHLVGYDDHDPARARLMHERERSLFHQIIGESSPTLWKGLLSA